MKNLIIALIALFVGFFAWSLYSVFELNQEMTYSENGIIETLQALVLAVACLIYVVTAIRQTRDDKLTLFFLSWLCLGFVLREVDVEDFDLPSLLIYLGSGSGRNLMLSFGLLTLLAFGFKNFRTQKQQALLLLRSAPGKLLMLALVMLVIGSILERQTQIRHYVYWEEIFELAGFTLILMAAVILSSHKPLGQNGSDPHHLN